MPDTSCIIVTYWNEATILDCIESISNDLSPYSGEIIIVDNASGDSTLQEIRAFKTNDKLSLRIIENFHNLGFARAVNEGIAAANGEYVLILNPDTVIHKGFFEKTVSFLSENSEYGIVGPKHLNRNGETEISCREFPTHLSLLFYMTGLAAIFHKNRIFNSWKMGYFDHNSSREVQQPMGACLLTRSKDLREIGFLDERFTMFFNDVDLCLRYNIAGKKAYYLSEAEITHFAGHSVFRKRSKMIILSHTAYVKYFNKYYKGFKWAVPNFIMFVLLTVSCLARLMFQPVIGLFRRKV